MNFPIFFRFFQGFSGIVTKFRNDYGISEILEISKKRNFKNLQEKLRNFRYFCRVSKNLKKKKF
jgi:hypothetical protein